MCVDPITMAVASFAMSAASQVVGFQAQGQQYEAQQQHYENNRAAANKAAVETYASTQNRILQEQAAASDEAQKLNIESAKGRATAHVAAGEAGVAGLSVDALIGDFYGQQGRYERTLDNNLQMQSDYLRGEMDATTAQAEGRINSVDQGTPPSFADAALRIVGGGLDAYTGYRRNKQLGT
jgi:outer membrane PBP1 activator LpoA protein